MACCDPFPTSPTTACTPSNCETGQRLAFSGKFNFLAAADGFNYDTVSNADGAGGAASGQRGTYVQLQPYGKKRMRLLGIQVTGVDGVTGNDFADIISIGDIRHNNKTVRPTLNSSFKDYTTPGGPTNPDIFLKNGINPINPQCLPVFGADDPLDIAIQAGGADISGVELTFEVEYVMD